MRKLCFQKHSLRNHLFMGMGAMFVPLLILGVGAITGLESAIKAFEGTAKEVNEEMFPLTRLQILILQASTAAEKHLAHNELTEQQKFLQLSEKIDKIFAEIKANNYLDTSQEQVLFLAAQTEWQQIQQLNKLLSTLPEPIKSQRAKIEIELLAHHNTRASEFLNQAYDLANKEIAANLAHAYHLKRQGVLIVATVFGLGLVICTVTSILIARPILLQLRVLTKGVSKFGDGEMEKIDLRTQNELGELAATFNLVASKLQQSQLELKRLARTDQLTNLPNRACFQECLLQAVQQAKKNPNYMFALLFVDLDRFKLINDSLGHLVGDQLLIATARRLETCVRDQDTIARLGGDEFALILDNIKDESYAKLIAERIQQELSLPFHLGERSVFTSASTGVVLGTQANEYLDDLLRNADLAMYRAKTAGKANMHTQAVQRLQLETDLRQALERQEFQVHYQPIVRLATGSIIGFEALVRWHHQVQGIISPTQFIPVAEETGLIVTLGHWVLQEACRQLQAWQLKFPLGWQLTMNINVSAKQLLEPDFSKQVAQIIRASNLSASSLRLELTESVLMENTNSAITAIEQLQAEGISLVIDDFGTGYSSLSYLHRFPIDSLKIDRSFISQISDGDKNLEIIRAIVMLSQALKMDVVAEGIETAEHLTQLCQLQCEYGQGYFFSRPLDNVAIEVLIAQQYGAESLHVFKLVSNGKTSFSEVGESNAADTSCGTG